MGAQSKPVKVGTLRWSWHDNTGKVHSFDIPQSYYVPDCTHRLFSPQHWAQMLIKQRKGRARETTDAKITKLVWGNGLYELDIPLDRSNVATI